jgi:hypothetical protein
MPSTFSELGLKNVSSTSVMAKSSSIVTRTSSFWMASGKRGVPCSPGRRAPTVPMPNGEGAAVRSVVARPPVQSSQVSAGAVLALASAPMRSRSPAAARVAPARQSSPWQSAAAAPPAARTSPAST